MNRKAAPLATIVAAALLGFACGGSDEAERFPQCEGLAADEMPDDLVCTGLYEDGELKTLSAAAQPFVPAQPFWSDGYEKDRYIILPDGKTINATSMDDWDFPVGTKAFKTFRKGERKIETRLFWKAKEGTWRAAAFVWNPEGTKAVRGEGETLDLDGTEYTIPKSTECEQCHRGRKDKLLGFEAISLAQPGARGMTLAKLVEDGKLEPAPAQTTLTLPDPGIGVLHVNCGVTCHSGVATAVGGSTGLKLRVGFDEALNKPVNEWELFTTSVNAETKLVDYEGELRVVPGNPETSIIPKLMRERSGGLQMPPLATNVVDDDGVSAVESWIRALTDAPPPPSGTPPPGTPTPPGTPPPVTPPPPPGTCSGGGTKEAEPNDAAANPLPGPVVGTAFVFCGDTASASDVDQFVYTVPAGAVTTTWNVAYSTPTSPLVTFTVDGVESNAPTASVGKQVFVRVTHSVASSYTVTITFD